MAELRSGEVSWTDASVDSSKKGNSKDFLRLSPGSNIVRLLTLPHQYHQHKYLPEGGKKYGYRVNCAGANGGCPLCEGVSGGMPDKPKRRWFLGVVDRKTSSYKILDIGFSVFKSIQTLAKDDDWGDPSRYDIDIVVDPNGGSTGYYTVVAKPPKPLTAGDLVVREENDSGDLAEKVVPPTAEKVRERLARISEEIAQSGHSDGNQSNHNTQTRAASNTSTETVVDENGGDDYFQNFDETKK